MAAHKKSGRFKLGLAVVGSAVLFSGLVLFILGSSLTSETVSYRILFEESVKGMVIGSKVNFQGIPVGSVEDIRFAQGRTRVEIGVDPDKAEIQTVTFARMDRLIVTGQVTVELEGYVVEGEPLEPGGTIPTRKSAFHEFAQSLPEVVADADDLLLSLKVLASRLTSVLDDENRASMKRTLAHVEQLTGTMATRLDELIDDSRLTLAELRPAVASMQASFDKLGGVADSKDLQSALDSFRDAMNRVDRIEVEVLDLVKDLRGIVGGSRRSWLSALTTASGALDEIRMLARNLRMAPSALIYGRSNQEISVPATPAGGR